MGYSSQKVISIYKQSYVDKDSIQYGGVLLSKYDDNCSVIVENEFETIKLYCDTRYNKKELFRVWERGISYQPPPVQSVSIIR